MAHLVYKDRNIDLAERCVIGRHKGNHVVVLDEKASREHCQVVKDDGAWFIEDLGSANGTRLNGVKIDGRSKLRHGDRIGISRVVISFLDAGSGAVASLAGSWDRQALIGKLLGGNRLTTLLGSGTLASVYEARQVNLNRTVAVKVFHPGLLEANRMLADEIKRYTLQAGRVNDSGIASIHECGSDDGLLWYSMEFVDGEQVGALLERDGQLEWDLALVITERVCRALAKAHEQGMVHEGISPKSIMLSSDGRVKLLELGLATLLSKQQHLFKAERSQHHLAPEQLQGNEAVPATDIYAVGCLLFQLIAGRPPFAGADDVAAAHIEAAVPRISRFADCPDPIDKLILRMLAKNPEDRPQQAAALADDLRVIRHQFSASNNDNRRDSEVRQRERLANVERRARRPRRSNSVAGYLVSLGIIAALAIGGFVIINRKGTNQLPGGPDSPTTSGQRPAPTRPTPPVSQRPTPPSIQPQPAPADPVETAITDPAWRQVQTEVASLTASDRWAEAERAVLRYRQQQTNGSPVADAADSLLQQVRLDAGLWYDQVTNALPAADDAAGIRQLLDRLATLRRQVLPSQLADIANRTRNVNNLLERHLAVASRKATQLLESGKGAELPALADELAPAFADTQLEHRFRSFAARCQEGARAPWLGDWAATRATLLETEGEAALAAAAACFLTGDHEIATGLLLKIGDPGLRKRRDLLIGSSAKHISFAELAAMEHITITSGNASISDGALIGQDGQATELVVRDALRGRAWECRSSLTLPLERNAELLVQLGSDQQQPISIRFDAQGVNANVEGPNDQRSASHDLPEQPIDLHIRQEDGQITIAVNGTTILTAAAALPPQLRFQLTATGRGWRLHALDLLGVDE